MQRNERGITTSELLIAMVITALILVPLTSAMFVGLRTTSTAQARIAQSNAANLLASYFTTDVQNAAVVTPNGTEAAGVCPAPTTVALLLTAPGGQSSVSYYLGTGADATTLYRRTCEAGTATRPARVVRDLAGAPVFACSPDCAAATWQSLTATVAQQSPLDHGGMTFTVEGKRRVD